MSTMTAYQLVEWGAPPEFREVDVPTPATDEVLIRVAGVGLCHSDFLFLDTPPGIIPWELPFTLGHESAGWVEQLGADVDDLELGQPVAVAGIHSCGRCQYCLRGQDNYCPRGASGRGYGEDGGLAQFLVVPRRELVPLTTLDPRRVGPLTDAGATSYHAVKRAMPKLIPGSAAVVIGAGGLGSYAVQYLRRLTGAQVIAVDLVQQRLDLARELGAHDVLLSDDETPTRVRELTGGLGAPPRCSTSWETTRPCAWRWRARRRSGRSRSWAPAEAPRRCRGACSRWSATSGSRWRRRSPTSTRSSRWRRRVSCASRWSCSTSSARRDAYERFRRGDLRSRAVVTPNG